MQKSIWGGKSSNLPENDLTYTQKVCNFEVHLRKLNNCDNSITSSFLRRKGPLLRGPRGYLPGRKLDLLAPRRATSRRAVGRYGPGASTMTTRHTPPKDKTKKNKGDLNY